MKIKVFFAQRIQKVEGEEMIYHEEDMYRTFTDALHSFMEELNTLDMMSMQDKLGVKCNTYAMNTGKSLYAYYTAPGEHIIFKINNYDYELNQEQLNEVWDEVESDYYTELANDYVKEDEEFASLNNEEKCNTAEKIANIMYLSPLTDRPNMREIYNEAVQEYLAREKTK